MLFRSQGVQSQGPASSTITCSCADTHTITPSSIRDCNDWGTGSDLDDLQSQRHPLEVAHTERFLTADRLRRVQSHIHVGNTRKNARFCVSSIMTCDHGLGFHCHSLIGDWKLSRSCFARRPSFMTTRIDRGVADEGLAGVGKQSGRCFMLS